VIDAVSLEGLRFSPEPFVKVEGVVVGIFEGRNRWFVNFGADYETDFTVSLQGRALSTVRRLWPEPERWIGQRVRVKGFADHWNGIFIEWDFPEQLCFVGTVPYGQ